MALATRRLGWQLAYPLCVQDAAAECHSKTRSNCKKEDGAIRQLGGGARGVEKAMCMMLMLVLKLVRHGKKQNNLTRQTFEMVVQVVGPWPWGVLQRAKLPSPVASGDGWTFKDP